MGKTALDRQEQDWDLGSFPSSDDILQLFYSDGILDSLRALGGLG